MGSLGVSTRASIRKLISNSNFKSILTLTPVTVTIGSKGGYEVNTETESTSVTIDCIPANFIKSTLVTRVMGDLRQGEVRFVIRDDETIDAKGFDKVVFSGETFMLKEIRPIPFNEVTVAQIISCDREVDN
jgi:hypothetical protein